MIMVCNENIKSDLEKEIIDITDSVSMTSYALEFATRMHEGEFRKNGLPYISHPIKVAEYVSKFKISKEKDILITAAYLHDILENTNATYYDIVYLFGAQVASIVMELTTDEDLKNEIGKERYLEIKMKNMSSWALVIKLCDRLDNVSDLKISNEEFRNRYSKETIDIIDYLIKNRYLSKTHLNIIKEILKSLSVLYEYKENLVRDNTNKQPEKIKQLLKTIYEEQ